MNAPKPDEIEISLFGPGYGECIAIHPGDGDWIVVDSCIDPETNEPIVLRYFSCLGVDPAEAVQLVVTTHWHDDHIRGLGKLFTACRACHFVCSEALGNQDFFEVVYAQGLRLMAANMSGLSEFHEVLRELTLRAEVRGRRLPPYFAVADRCLWQKTGNAASVDCKIHSLSPSDAAIMASKLEIGKLLQKPKEPKRGIWPSGKNHASVVLWVSIGDKTALLGADLEETGNPDTGWQIILHSTTRPYGKASVFKVPHHGSATGYNEQVWSEMLENNPTAILSPYRLGGFSLPRKSDVQTICGHTDRAYITAKSPKSRVIKRDRAVEKTLKELGLSPRQVITSVGHIRLRAKQGEEWQIDLFENAESLECHSSK